MARYPADQKQKTYERILEVAGRLFRKQGYHATGLAQIMEEADLTKGGFYAHFSSKEDLLKKAIIATFAKTREIFFKDLENKADSEAFHEIMTRYLSRFHRDVLDEGCLAAALVPEVTRASQSVKQVFEEELLKTIHGMQKYLKPTEAISANEQALVFFALGLGALNLSRAFHDEKLSDKILKAARKYSDLKI